MELNQIFNTDNIKTKPLRNRSTKKDLYKKEQENILNKINNILGINKDNNIVYLYDIENSDEKTKQILDLSEDVKKYFKAGDWGFFKTEACKNNPVLLCKSVYKDMGYLVFGKAIDIFRNDVKIRTTQYMIGKISL